jgi:anaphase-promoting complex subunit 2
MSLSDSWRAATACIRAGGDVNEAALLTHTRIIRDAGKAFPQCLRAKVLRDVEARYIRPAAAALADLCGGNLGCVAVADVVRNAHRNIVDGQRLVQLIDCGLSVNESKGAERSSDDVEPRYALQCRALFETLVPRSLSSTLHIVFVANFRCFGQCSRAEQAQFLSLCEQLCALGFMPAVQEAVSWVLFDEIDDAVRNRASGPLGDRALPALREWTEEAAIPWLATVLSAGEDEKGNRSLLRQAVPHHSSQGTASLDQWRKRLAFHLHETLADIRINQMIQIIAGFPRSQHALHDLKECLLCTEKKSQLVRSMREQLSVHLLHAGTVIADVVQQYINLIKTLRFLDPSGVILESVSDPVRDCLRRRPDTVRCIVSGMTGEGDLYEELERGRINASRSTAVAVNDSGPKMFSPIMAIGEDEGDSDAGDDSDAETIHEDEFDAWEPEPIDAAPRQGRWRPGGDAIETLVAIYGSSEQIVKEYRALLADKLMNSFEFNLERETRILELLQQRFGNDAMHDCFIMLKDMRDSRIALATARAEAPGVHRDLEGFEATVISKVFWPKVAEEPTFHPPSDLALRMQLFGSSFERVKHPRKLQWQDGQGMVKLAVTFDDGRKLDLNLPPLQASIVLRFAHQSKWGVNELKNNLNIEDETALRRRLVLLSNLDVIRPTDSSAVAYEAIESANDLDCSGGVVDDETTQGIGGEEEGDEEERAKMLVYQNYILGMLNTLKSLPLSRIHTVLQMVMKTPPYDKTEAQLAVFMAQLVADGKVKLQAGMYKPCT